MKNLYPILKKSVLTLAIALMTTACAWSQTTWSGTVNYTSNTNLVNVVLMSDATVNVSSGVTVTVTGVISANAGYFFTLGKDGPGRLVLTGNNTYAGGTVVQAGTLQLSGSNNSTTGNVARNIITRKVIKQ